MNNWFKIGIILVLIFAVNNVRQYQRDRASNEMLKILESRTKASEQREADHQEYISKRKRDCLDIYQTEMKKWNNTESWFYKEVDDQCAVIYKETIPKSKEQCESKYDVTNLSPSSLKASIILERLSCEDGNFTRTF